MTLKKTLLALVGGLIAFLITAHVVWQELPKTLANAPHFRGGVTRMKMGAILSEIKEFQKNKSKLPITLAELGSTGRYQTDAWGHRMLYEVQAGKPILKSLGRDGKLGGVGFDADFTTKAVVYNDGIIDLREVKAGEPTLRQVLEEMGNNTREGAYAGNGLTCCVLNGLLWFGCFVWLQEKNTAPKPLVNRAVGGVGVLVLLGITVLGAAFMAMLHLPSGH